MIRYLAFLTAAGSLLLPGVANACECARAQTTTSAHLLVDSPRRSLRFFLTPTLDSSIARRGSALDRYCASILPNNPLRAVSTPRKELSQCRSPSPSWSSRSGERSGCRDARLIR